MAGLSGEDKQMICQTIRDRLAGKVSDETWNQFLRMIKPFSNPIAPEHASPRVPCEPRKEVCRKDRVMVDND